MVRTKLVSALQKAFCGQLNKQGIQREASWIAIGEKAAAGAQSDKAKALLNEYAEMLDNWRDREVSHRH